MTLTSVSHRSGFYEIDLEDMRTSAETLDWIFQVAMKSWATPDIVASLITAIDELIAPQANLCSCGVERGPIDVWDVVHR
jgi:hypothetical protein